MTARTGKSRTEALSWARVALKHAQADPTLASHRLVEVFDLRAVALELVSIADAVIAAADARAKFTVTESEAPSV